MEDGEEAAWRLANRVFHLMALTLTVITIVGIVAAPLIVNVMFPGGGFDLELEPDDHFGFTNKRDLTVYLTRIMFPFLPLVSFAAVAMGLLNSKGKFGIPSSASSFFNLGSVVVGIWGYYASQRLGLHPATGMAVGVLVGGALQFLIQMPSMWRVGFRYRPTISFRDARVPTSDALAGARSSRSGGTTGQRVRQFVVCLIWRGLGGIAQLGISADAPANRHIRSGDFDCRPAQPRQVGRGGRFGWLPPILFPFVASGDVADDTCIDRTDGTG